MRSWRAPCTPVQMSDAVSIAMPTVYHDASAMPPAAVPAVGAADAAVGIVRFVVDVWSVGRGLACGRESVTMRTPEETMATASFYFILVCEKGEKKTPSARGAGAAGGKVKYYLFGRVSLAHEKSAE